VLVDGGADATHSMPCLINRRPALRMGSLEHMDFIESFFDPMVAVAEARLRRAGLALPRDRDDLPGVDRAARQPRQVRQFCHHNERGRQPAPR